MNWIIRTLTCSVGKKLIMAVTGLSFCLFLVSHLAGNLTIFKGPKAFVSYAESLHSLGALILMAELGLLVLAVCHICFGIWLFIGNLTARPVGYAVKKNAGGRTLSSAIMPYTGLFLLVFIIIHLITFHFADRGGKDVYYLVHTTFTSPGYVIFYLIAMIAAAFHVKHGFWSAFQTIGANHPKYMPVIKKVGLVFSLLVGFGFGCLPIYLSLS
ncbi:MAG: succinate dehydrogenase cytochrome b subunit [Deltaproteobacteria bacterium]|nr:succinate dehydrogenase cytochrome b subunit [Deltaproteobacteria bacterium]